MTAAKIPNQDTGMVVLEGDDLASRRSIPTGSGQVLPPNKSNGIEKCAGQRAERGAEAGTERGEEAAAVAARSVGAHVEEFGGDAEGAAEEIGVHAKQAGEPLQRGHLALERRVGEGELIFLRLAGFRNSLLAREFIGEFAEAGGVTRARQAVLRGVLERIESAGKRALRLPGDRGLVRRTEARIVQDALIQRQKRASDLLLLAEELLVERVNVGALLIGQLACLCLRTGHKPPMNCH